MSNAILIRATGGPEVLEWAEVAVPEPGPGMALVRHTAIGLNFIDIYVRTGLYTLGALPVSPGMEAAGVVEAVGAGVSGLAPGDRVAYVSPTPGAYAERRVLDADLLVKLPADIPDEAAAALLLKGMTAEVLLHRMTRPKAGDTVLVHAAAGGVGQILCAWGAALGLTVIGTVSTDAKAEEARAAGARHVIVTAREDIAARVAEITGGRGCACVYDGVGAATFAASLEAVAPFGAIASFGNASGPVPPVNIATLGPKCITLSRPSLFPFLKDRGRLEAISASLFQAVRAGIVRAGVGRTFALREAADAHRALESRATTGQTLLIP
ncbi:quinone oxidoreductase [Xanthobacter sp. V0B-10]|uniref:quinone oxidoreductase family protein n=1 Tax=Xanthobacter albus TaxID=3119929 RepID=UPI00372C2B96